MNEGLIERWNERVGKNDTVYHLGDFTLTTRIELVDEWLGRLNGQIRLVKGNHDNWTKKFDKLKNGGKIKWIKDYAERSFSIDGTKHKFVMFHFPLLFWHQSHYGSFMMHGHCHGNAQTYNVGKRRMDVGVDCNDWRPVHLEEIVSRLNNVGLNPHHPRHNANNES